MPDDGSTYSLGYRNSMLGEIVLLQDHFHGALILEWQHRLRPKFTEGEDGGEEVNRIWHYPDPKDSIVEAIPILRYYDMHIFQVIIPIWREESFERHLVVHDNGISIKPE